MREQELRTACARTAGELFDKVRSEPSMAQTRNPIVSGALFTLQEALYKGTGTATESLLRQSEDPSPGTIAQLLIAGTSIELLEKKYILGPIDTNLALAMLSMLIGISGLLYSLANRPTHSARYESTITLITAGAWIATISYLMKEYSRDLALRTFNEVVSGDYITALEELEEYRAPAP